MLKDQLSDTEGLADSPLILNKSQSMDSYNPNDQTNAMQKLFSFFFLGKNIDVVAVFQNRNF